MREALHAYLISAGAVALVLSPLAHGQDGFPLSTYPMFSARRPAVATIARALAASADGEEISLSPRLVSGSSEPMQAVSTVNRAFASGTPAAEALCRAIADRVGTEKPEALEVRLELIEVDVEGWFAGERSPRRRQRFATCPVSRAPH